MTSYSVIAFLICLFILVYSLLFYTSCSHGVMRVQKIQRRKELFMISRLARFLLIIVPLLGIFFSAPVASAWQHHHYWRHHHHYWRNYGYNRRPYYDRDWYAYPRRY